MSKSRVRCSSPQLRSRRLPQSPLSTLQVAEAAVCAPSPPWLSPPVHTLNCQLPAPGFACRFSLPTGVLPHVAEQEGLGIHTRQSATRDGGGAGHQALRGDTPRHRRHPGFSSSPAGGRPRTPQASIPRKRTCDGLPALPRLTSPSGFPGLGSQMTACLYTCLGAASGEDHAKVSPPPNRT